VHKKTCAQEHATSTANTASSSANPSSGPEVTRMDSDRGSPPKGVDAGVIKLFTRLKNKTFLYKTKNYPTYY
jgi:hypothetical protein